MEKITLVTGGCSFSECITPHVETWPIHLHNSLGDEIIHIPTGMGSQGNGLISRRIIYTIENKNKNDGIPYSDMLVGIMWSGPARSEIYKKDGVNPRAMNIKEHIMENPTSIMSDEKKWYILNPWWNGYPYVRDYYSIIEHKYLLIQSYEHILRTQDYLKLRGIKYFMTTYTGEVLNKELLFEETKHLYNMIDFDNFLSVEGCYEWCRDNTNIAFKPNDNHPSNEQHKTFTNEVIIPFLKEKGYV